MPAFLITIDTEGDNLWAQPREITTRNSRFLPRFQALAERYGFKPTYLTNYEMALCPDFRVLALDVLRRGAAEIGMHLHAWNSPPNEPLTDDDYRHQPYLMEYPEPVMRSKIAFLTDLLESTFQVKMLSHRAGRWSFNEVYARILIEHGYCADCSVTPRVSWKDSPGDPARNGGTDYSAFPDVPYRVDPCDIARTGQSDLLEVPMSVVSLEPEPVARLQRHLPPRSLPARILGRCYPPVAWLRPNGRNLSWMLRVLAQARRDGRAHVEFMLHSSEFMPGGSPVFRSAASIEKLYDDIEILFDQASLYFQGETLSGFAARVAPTLE